jgi:membrane protease YdiL (CAAX protease family)
VKKIKAFILNKPILAAILVVIINSTISFVVFIISKQFRFVDFEIVSSIILISFYFLFYRKFIHKHYSLFTKTERKELLFISISFVIYFIFSITLTSVFIKLNLLPPQKEVILPLKNIIIAIILAPIEEELFYRGILINILLNKKNHSKIRVLFSIIVISLLFSLFHMRFDVQFIQIFIFSIFASIFYLKKRNLILIILFHSTYNLLVVFNIKGYFVNTICNL